MKHWITLGLLLDCSTTAAVVTSFGLSYQLSSSLCPTDEAFLTLRKLAISECVVACKVRKLCAAVKYWTHSRDCEMLSTNNGVSSLQGERQKPCVFIEKQEIKEHSQAFEECQICDENYVCDLATNSCIIQECRKLHVANATVYGNMLSVGSKIIVTCKDQLETTSSQSICQANGTWSNVPTCSQDCGSPPTVPNAIISIGKTIVGAVRNVMCLEGYVLIGTTFAMLTCQENGTWSSVQFNCIISCPEPPVVSNANSLPGSTLPGAVRPYTCDQGYGMLENVTLSVTCLDDGTWTPVEFECLISCGEPPVVENATASSGDTLFGMNRNYTCHSGYDVTDGSVAVVTCQENGTWTHVQFECVPEIITCPDPPVVSNATALSGTNLAGTTRNYSCNLGYGSADVMPQSVTCLDNGTWTPVEFVCLISCGEPPMVGNASVSPGGTLQGTTRNYTCLEGFIISGVPVAVVTCQDNGTWTSVQLECVPISCPDPPVVSNATALSGSTLPGATINYSCDRGYGSADAMSLSVMCLDNGTWTPVEFVCLLSCGEPPTVGNASVSPGGTLKGTTRNYTCLAGFVMGGGPVAVVTCQENGTWTPVQCECVPITCPEPPLVPYANALPGSTLPGAVRNYTCNVGYDVVGNVPLSVTCMANATWTPAQFVCLISCDEPPMVGNASVSPGGTLQGMTRNFTCNIGFIITPGSVNVVNCQENGTWTPLQFGCVPITCPEPPLVPNATALPGSTLPGAVQNYTCNVGYAVVGNVSLSVTCMANATWTPAQFVCLPLACPSDWIQLGTGCYYIPVPLVTMGVLSAKAECISKQAHLVEIETVEENALLQTYLDTNYGRVHWWTGLTDEVTEGTWIWSESGNPPTFFDWVTSREGSSGTHENYVVISNSQGWADFNADMAAVPLCERG